MKSKLIVFALALLAVSLMFSSDASAQCADGKFALQITTPSGKQKSICVPEAARQGIENAAEHADTTVIPTECSCWSLQQIKDYAAKYDLSCRYEETEKLKCYKDTYYYTVVFELYPKGYDYVCVNHPMDDVIYIKTSEEVNACSALLEDYIK